MPLLILLFIAWAIIVMSKASHAANRVDDLQRKVEMLEKRLQKIAAASQSATGPVKNAATPTPVAAIPKTEPAPAPGAIPPVIPPPKPDEITALLDSLEPSSQSIPAEEEAFYPKHTPTRATTPPPMPSKTRSWTAPKPEKKTVAAPASAINWEQFMGAKLFAWMGGLALFLGIAFFVRYSFEHNLIPPAMRVTVGFITGIALLAGGVVMKRRETAVTAQTLCSTGILVLYAVTFACHAYYKFAWFGQAQTFSLMTLITITAFVLSVGMNALAVAVLGIAGGFLTPALLSTGEDAPLALFGYIAFLDAGLLAVAVRRKWKALPVLGAIGTIIMQIGWVATFFIPRGYADGHKTWVAMAIFGGFQMLFLAANAISRNADGKNRNFAGSALSMGIMAMCMAFFFLGFPGIGHRPGMLFGYVIFVDLGLIALSVLNKRLSIVATFGEFMAFALLAVWTLAYLNAAHIAAVLAVYLILAALHLAVPAVMRKNGLHSSTSVINALPVLALPFLFLSLEAMALHPLLLFGSVLLVSAGLVALEFFDPESENILAAGGITSFALLGVWTAKWLTDANLYTALGLYLVFALFHSLAPAAIHKLRKKTPPWWCNLFPALSLLLVMMPMFMLTHLSFLVWPVMLLVDILAVALAALTAALLPVLVVLVLTLIAAAAWLFRIPADLTGLPSTLFIIGGFSVFFIVAAAWAARRLTKSGWINGRMAGSLFGDTSDPANLAVQIPTLSAVLPFLLLIMATARLPLANPSPVFALAMLLVALLLGLARIMSLEALPGIGLVSVLALEHAWHFRNFDSAHPVLPLEWYLAFYGVFTIFPFLFHRRFSGSSAPWAAAALAGVLHFYLVLDVVHASFPVVKQVIGLLPAAFSLPPLLGVCLIARKTPADSPARNSQLAWFGGVALFFITLTIPLQFHNEWWTIGWALEGAALCWLFCRVPHKGLPVTGTGLLAVAFVRLAVNPAVLEYHARLTMPLLNWYLYTYGIVAVCLFAAAWLLAPPRNIVMGSNMPPVLQALATALIFLLVNIEIADYFSSPGSQSLVFEFSGNFARDMSYSIAWAVFSLLMLVIGISKRLAPVRYGSIGLLAVTLLKLFLHDLSQLDQLYRIAALIVVAVIAIFASFLYQRFLGDGGNDEGRVSPKGASLHE